MLHLVILPFALACTLLAACGQCGAPVPGADPGERALFEVAAADAFVTVVMRPGRWTALRDDASGLVPEPARDTTRAASTPWALVPMLTDGALAIESALPSLDPARPVVAGLFVSAQPELLDAAAELSGVLDGKGFVAIRHRLVLPATDAAKLAAELRALIAQQGLELVDAREPSATRFIGIYPGADHVRLEIVPEDIAPGGKPDKAWRDAWGARLSKEPHADLTASAALLRALAPDAFLSAWVQASRMRVTAGAMGATQVAAALQMVEPDMKKVLLTVGTAEVMAGFSLLAPERALVHDVGLALGGQDGLAIRSAASLTPRGRALFEQATALATPVAEPTQPDGGWAQASLRLSLGDLYRALEMPPVFARTSERELAEAVMECGPFCSASLHGLLVLLKRVVSEQPPEMQAALPRSLTFIGGAPSAPGAPHSFALAFGYEGGKLPKEAIARFQGDLPRGFALTSATSDDGDFAYLAFGLAPDAAFKPGARGPLWSFDVDLDGLGALLDAVGEDPLPSNLGRLVGRTDLTGAALSSSLVLVPKGAKRTLEPVDFASAPTADAPAPTPASDCLERAVHAVAAGWKGVDQAPPEMRQVVLARARAEMEAPLACAEADPTTKAGAGILRTLLTRF